MPLVLILSATVALYFPYLSNELVFDDHNLFNGQHSIYDLAITPFSKFPRTFPLFTLGFVETIWRSIEANRLLSLLIHVANSLLLCRIFFDLLRLCEPQKAIRSSLITATTGALLFALHPVATYGAAYLAQRTTLLAMFFSLWSLFFFLRSFRRNAWADIFTAILFYTLAIFSKEHAIMLPAAAALISVLQSGAPKENIKKAGLYLLGCAIPAIYVFLALKGVVGAYEPAGESSSQALPQIALSKSMAGQWSMSILNQLGQFFHYIALWVVPTPGSMSIDMRVDFVKDLQPVKIALYISAFAIWLGCGIALLRRRQLTGLAGLGLLYLALLYCTEFSTFRLQEPFVLYRSYLWAPGILIVLVAILARFNLSPKPALVLAALLAISLFPLSRDRLESMRSEFSVWNDAATKLKSNDLPGADRIFFNLGNELAKKGLYKEALTNMDQVIALDPDSPNGYLGRGMVHSRLGEHQQALTDFERALTRTRDISLMGTIEYNLASTLLAQGKIKEARALLATSAGHGNSAAKIALQLHSRDSTIGIAAAK